MAYTARSNNRYPTNATWPIPVPHRLLRLPEGSCPDGSVLGAQRVVLATVE